MFVKILRKKIVTDRMIVTIVIIDLHKLTTPISTSILIGDWKYSISTEVSRLEDSKTSEQEFH